MNSDAGAGANYLAPQTIAIGSEHQDNQKPQVDNIRGLIGRTSCLNTISHL